MWKKKNHDIYRIVKWIGTQVSGILWWFPSLLNPGLILNARTWWLPEWKIKTYTNKNKLHFSSSQKMYLEKHCAQHFSTHDLTLYVGKCSLLYQKQTHQRTLSHSYLRGGKKLNSSLGIWTASRWFYSKYWIQTWPKWMGNVQKL